MKVVLFWLFHWWREVLSPPKRRARLSIFINGITLNFVLAISSSPAIEMEQLVVEKKIIEATDASKMSRDQMFKVFDGMYVVPRKEVLSIGGYAPSLLQVDFYNDTALWYGILNHEVFTSPPNWYTPLLETNLVNPEAGWFGTPENWFDMASLLSDSARTAMPIANFSDKLLESSKTVSLTLFYNDPKTWIDTPALMNAFTVFGLIIQTATAVKAQDITREASDILGVLKTLKSLGAVLPELLTAAKVGCDVYAIAGKVKIQDCDQWFGNLDALTTQLSNSVAVEECNLSVNGEVNNINLLNYIKVIKDQLISLSGKKAAKAKILANISFFLKQYKQEICSSGATDFNNAVKVSLVQHLLVEPLLGTDTLLQVGKESYSSKQVSEALLRMSYAKERLNIVTSFVELMRNGNIQIFEAVANLGNFLHRIANLHKSMVDVDNKTFDAFMRATLDSFNSVIQYSLPDIALDVFKQAVLNNLGIAKAVSLLSVADRASAISYDFMTKPSIIHFDVTRDNQDKFTFIRKAPDFNVFRYLLIDNESLKYLIDYDISPLNPIISGDKQAFPTIITPKGNHYLVTPGFTADLQIDAKLTDLSYKDDLNQLINDGKSRILWHVYRYPIGDVDIQPRNYDGTCNDAWISPITKNINCINEVVPKLNWVETFSGDTDTLSYSNIFNKNHKGYLTHKTSGVYRDVAGFSIGDKEINKSNMYLNTFNIYVLEDLSVHKDSFLKSSCVWSGEAGNYLNIAPIAPDVLSPYYIAVQSGGAWVDIKENGIPHQRVKLNSLDGTFYVYDYILRAWENTVLKGEPEKFQLLLKSNKLGNHIISFKLSELSDVNNRCPFSDVPVNQWYTKPIIELQKLGIIKGYEDGSFGLNNPVNRAEFLKMAMLAADSSKKDSDFLQTETSFSDVPKSHWASGYINNAKSKHIIDGFKDGKFKPDSGVDRVAAAKMVAIAFNFMPIRTLSQMFQDATNALLGEKTILWCPPYKDIINNQWYCPYITKLKEIQVMTGYDDGSFKPANKMTRAETATAICRAYSYKKQYNTALCD